MTRCLFDGTFTRRLFLLIMVLLVMILSEVYREEAEAGWRGETVPESYTPVRILEMACISNLKTLSLIASFFQHDLFYVAPNWTLFDVGRRKNMGSVMLNYSRKEFPKLLLESVHFTSHMFCTYKLQKI